MDPLKELKGFDAGQQLALLKKLGGKEVKDALLRGDVTVEIKEAIKMLFDKNGRRIPEGLKAKVVDPDLSIGLKQPTMETANNYYNRQSRFEKFFNLGICDLIFLIFNETSALNFKLETVRLLKQIKLNKQVANILNGVWLPVFLPRYDRVSFPELLGRYLKVFMDNYPGKITDGFARIEDAIKRVDVGATSFHYPLVSKSGMKTIVGIFFPEALLGFSVDAAREQMNTLPPGFVLSGMDTFIAMAMYEDILIGSSKVPGLNLASLWSGKREDVYFHFFRNWDGRLGFKESILGYNADSVFSNGLLYIGDQAQ